MRFWFALWNVSDEWEILAPDALVFSPTFKVNGLPFNRYTWLTTHNSFAVFGTKSLTRDPVLGPTNQEYDITSQLQAEKILKVMDPLHSGELISSRIAEGGPYASRNSYVKLLRSVKRETLNLIETFLDKAEDQPQIGKQFVPPMMDHVLADYAWNLPDARESEVLSLFATIINK